MREKEKEQFLVLCGTITSCGEKKIPRAGRLQSTLRGKERLKNGRLFLCFFCSLALWTANVYEFPDFWLTLNL